MKNLWLSLLVVPFLYASIATAEAPVYWTIEVQGVLMNNEGNARLYVDKESAVGPNPEGSVWSCSEWVFFHKKFDGSLVSPDAIEKMYQLALTAAVANKTIRVSIYKLNDSCFTSQILPTFN